ncbi:MAG: hypothetical protein ACI9BK_003467 [Acidimicrobiales bacterium]|jgi:hypothetical protein
METTWKSSTGQHLLRNWGYLNARSLSGLTKEQDRATSRSGDTPGTDEQTWTHGSTHKPVAVRQHERRRRRPQRER